MNLEDDEALQSDEEDMFNIIGPSYEHVTGNHVENLEGMPIANDVDHEVPISNVTRISLVEETHNVEDIIRVENDDDGVDCYSCDDYYFLESNEEDDDLESEEDDVVEGNEDPVHDDRDFDDPELYVSKFWQCCGLKILPMTV